MTGGKAFTTEDAEGTEGRGKESGVAGGPFPIFHFPFSTPAERKWRTQEGLRHLRGLHEAGHPDRAGIWKGWADYLLEECLEIIEQQGQKMPSVGSMVFNEGDALEPLPPDVAEDIGGHANEQGRHAMGPEHEAHLARVNAIFELANSAKYRRGQEAHGGRLWEKDLDYLLLSNLMEHMDGINYVLAALEQRGITREDILSFIHND
jgi:hypothetical protein